MRKTTMVFWSLILGLTLMVWPVAGCSPEKAPKPKPGPAAVQPEQKDKNNGESKPVDPVSQIPIVKGTVLQPIDEAPQNPDFQEFRADLMTALKEKDIEFIKQHIDEKIRYSFGEEKGLKIFFHQWGLNKNPGQSRFWGELQGVLELGGSYNDSTKTVFTAPYVFSRFPQSVDGFQHVAVIGKDVMLYKIPDIKSDILGRLNYNIVKLAGDSNQNIKSEWLRVEVTPGVTGYVQGKYTRSPIDYRASFTKIDGTWKMNFFVAGD